MHLGMFHNPRRRISRPGREPVYEKHRFQQFEIAVHSRAVQASLVRSVAAVVLLRGDGSEVGQALGDGTGFVESGHLADVAFCDSPYVTAEPGSASPRTVHEGGFGEPAPAGAREIVGTVYL